ncbi:hypothetical protein BOS5A_200040 [Bosea sp. EC-HK365B]|nr:hypothetical protein BOSE21B_100039 [Bosea sp. 21B]CAD5286969.1 hypothetical protein BOSE7B_41489 [Bosea sp. 7B]VVT57345.1 hypothetical protein BOS5A_200040 [Bosea sp. EC-HK365B]VXC95241.1 hypothetical protein BOSE127_80274 [Bosea sp. 127]
MLDLAADAARRQALWRIDAERGRRTGPATAQHCEVDRAGCGGLSISARTYLPVMVGLVPTIHVFAS